MTIIVFSQVIKALSYAIMQSKNPPAVAQSTTEMWLSAIWDILSSGLSYYLPISAYLLHIPIDVTFLYAATLDDASLDAMLTDSGTQWIGDIVLWFHQHWAILGVPLLIYAALDQQTLGN